MAMPMRDWTSRDSRKVRYSASPHGPPLASHRALPTQGGYQVGSFDVDKQLFVISWRCRPSSDKPLRRRWRNPAELLLVPQSPEAAGGPSRW